MARPPLFREPPLILAVFSAGFAATVFGSLATPDVVHARAVWSIWPVLILGGIATARFLRRAPGMEGTGWLGWWAAGLLAYLVHLWFAWGGLHGFGLASVLDAQGLIVLAANITLLLLWVASVAAALVPEEPGWEQALQAAATAVFIAAALVSTLAGGVHPVSAGLGGGLLVLWVLSLLRRFA